MKKRKIFASVLTAVFISLTPLQALAQPIDPSFNPNKIVEDTVFSDVKTFGDAAGIQKFLESKNSVLANTTPDFLMKLKEPSIIILKQGLEDPRPELGRLRTAAELIWDASQAAGINAQVMLVTLNKEQSLITGHQNSEPAKLQKALDFALGFGCPDSTGCKESLFPGFYFQLFGNYDAAGNRYIGAAKSLMKSFLTEGGRGPSFNGKISKVGEVITLDNTMGGYEGIIPNQTITIANKATAALYRFTPHVFNGNYNFWRFFTEWFRYPNGTLLKLTGDANTYIIENGYRMLIPSFVVQARGLDLNKTITVSPTEIEAYPQNKLLGPADNTVVQVATDPQMYVFINNIKRPASRFVLSQRGLSTAPILNISTAESQMFEQGQVLIPTDGSVIKGEKGQEVYLVENGTLKLFSAFTFAQRGASKTLQTVPDSEITSYPKFGFVAPETGTLIKSDSNQTVFYVDGGLKKPISAGVYKDRGFKAANIVKLSNEELAGIPIGAFTTPKERSVFKEEKSGNVYLFKDGQKHIVSAFVQKQRNITADYTVSSGEVGEWFDGIPIPPSNGTIVKGDKTTAVYLVENAQLRPLTYDAFKRRKISNKNIKVLPEDEVFGYAKGEVLTK